MSLWAKPPVGPTRAANGRRNAGAAADRRWRWREARDSLWAVVEPLVPEGGRIAVVGAGNADDLPLTRLAARAALVELIDCDPRASRRAVRRELRRVRCVLRVLDEDVTLGAADDIVSGRPWNLDASRPVGEGGYDLVIGDLLYTQLLFPALKDAGVETARRAAMLAQTGPAITDAVVSRLHASGGLVVHVHDIAGWWPGFRQPIGIDAALEAPTDERLARSSGCDPRESLARLNIHIVGTARWRWRFAEDVDYLVEATVAVSGPRAVVTTRGVAMTQPPPSLR